MKRWSFAAALLAVLTLLLCACGAKKDKAAQTGLTGTMVAAEGATGLVVSDGELTLRFTRSGEDWVWVDDTDFPLDQTAVAELLALPTSMAAAEAVTTPGELVDYGLDATNKYVTVTADGAESTVYVGTQTSDGRWYALTPDGAVHLADKADGEALSRSIYSMAILPELPKLTAESLRSVTLRGAGETEETELTFITDESGARRIGTRDVTEKTAALVSELGKLTVSSCVDYDPAEGAAEVCGLDAPEAAVEITYLDNKGSEKTMTLSVGSSTGDGGRYVLLGGDTTIYRMEESDLAQILTLSALGLS